MVGIMLYVEPNECLCDSESDGKFKCGWLRGPIIVEDDVESNVEECSGKVSSGSEFLASAYDFEYFPLDLAFEVRAESVAV